MSEPQSGYTTTEKWPVFKLTWIEENVQITKISGGGDGPLDEVYCPFCDVLVYSDSDLMRIGDNCRRCRAVVIEFK